VSSPMSLQNNFLDSILSRSSLDPHGPLLSAEHFFRFPSSVARTQGRDSHTDGALVERALMRYGLRPIVLTPSLIEAPGRSATPSLSGFPGLSDCGIEGYGPLQQEHERNIRSVAECIPCE
jgi:hypothetical protein